MDKSSPRTIFTGLYKLTAGQLGTAPSSSRICIQQCHECNHWHLPILHEQGLPPEAVNKPASPVIVLQGSMLQDLDQLHSQLKVSITEAQECYQKAADHQQMLSPAFRIGDHVYVKAKFFCTTQPSRKLAEKNLGPFEIIGTPGTHSITVCLPQQFQAVHPMFH